MKSKLMLLTLSMVVVVSLLAGCATNAPAQKPAASNTASTAPAKTDTVTSASQAPDNTTFEQKISKDGNYIIITNKDLTFTKDLTVDGTFTKKGADGKDVVARSLAFASTKPDKSIDKRFTVTAPNMVIKSPNTLLEDGIFKGDIYVQSEGFTTKDATIDGNLHFATQALMDAFCADDKTKISGKVDVKAYTK